MDLPQAADALGLAASTLRWQIKNRKLRARKMGGRWYVSDEEVARYARENRQQRGVPTPECPMNDPYCATCDSGNIEHKGATE